jgi:hypothetical protein
MISRHHGRLGILLALELAIIGGCSVDAGNDGGSAGSVSSAGTPASAGTVGMSGSSSGGPTGTAGTSPSAGAPTGNGGSAATAGMGGMVMGSAGTNPKGGTESGGTSSTTGGTAGGAGAPTAGSSTGGTGSGTCQKGQVKASEVVIMGESFYAIAPQYNQKRIEEDARKAGSLGANESYRNVAVSGQNMNYIATTEWTAATQGGASVKFVIMDGGGIDCLQGGTSCATCSNTFKTLLDKMGAAGVKDVLYTRYPEPGAPPGSNASLKTCLDNTMPAMQTTCAASTSPKCHWVDLRPVFVAGDTTDGLHPTQSGGEHVGDLIWSEMVKNCLAQ